MAYIDLVYAPDHLVELAQRCADETGHTYAVGEVFEGSGKDINFHTGKYTVGDYLYVKACTSNRIVCPPTRKTEVIA